MRASRPEVVAPSRRAMWRALGVLLALCLSGDAVAAEKTSAPAAAPAKVAPAKVAPANTAPATKSAAVKPWMRTPSNAMVAVKPSAVTPARSAGKGMGVANAPSLEQQVAYQYNALGRRDPFQAMAGGTFVGDDLGGDAPPDVGGIKVVGIVWGASDKFALVEDARGTSRVLRAGDKVMNGVVATLKRDAVVVRMTVDGQTEQVAIPLTRKGDQTNANR